MLIPLPRAELYGPRGLIRKRPDLAFQGALEETPASRWEPDLTHAPIEGVGAFREVAFLHRASRTLMLADHLFSYGSGHPWLTRLATVPFGAWRKPGGWPAWVQRWIAEDRPALLRSIRHIHGWDFDRIALSHGRIVSTGGRAALARAYGID